MLNLRSFRMNKLLIIVSVFIPELVWAGKAEPLKLSSLARSSLHEASNFNSKWNHDNWNKIRAFIESRSSLVNQVAVFDFDNTLIKNDIGDATLIHMLVNDQIESPPSWQSTSRHLTAGGLASLNKHCPLDANRSSLKVSSNPQCLTAILCVYKEGFTWDGVSKSGTLEERCVGKPAFTTKSPATQDTIKPSYAWNAALLAGNTPENVRNAAREAFKKYTKAPIGQQIKIGYIEGLNAYIRVYEEMRDLVKELKNNNFDVWISTASSQYFVDPIAPEYFGIPAERVIGVRSVLKEGIITSSFLGCGSFEDGQDIINYRQGKKCWINKIIFQRPKDQQLHTRNNTKRKMFIDTIKAPIFLYNFCYKLI